MQRLTKEQAAIIGLYTRICCGPFSDIQKPAETLTNRPICTHEFADPKTSEELKPLVKPLFIEICHKE